MGVGTSNLITWQNYHHSNTVNFKISRSFTLTDFVGTSHFIFLPDFTYLNPVAYYLLPFNYRVQKVFARPQSW